MWYTWGHPGPFLAGKRIEFYRYADEITHTEELLASCNVPATGIFSICFNIEAVTCVFSNLGQYRAILFAEPGMLYEVILPPRLDKEIKDLLNPYFSPIEVQLANKTFNDQELNTKIHMFNDAFLPFYNKHIMDASSRTDFTRLDMDVEKMETPFVSSRDTYFNAYRRYRYGLIRHLGYQQKSRKISDTYFRNEPVLYNNTAYMELFNQVYDKYFYHFSRTSEGKCLLEAIGMQNLDSLRNCLARDEVLGNGELLNLVILKCLHDEFYDDNYSRSALLALLDQFIEKSTYEIQKGIARHIRTKVTRLLAGFEPPGFALYNQDSALVSLSQFRGKYVYLNFCSCFSYTCLNEFAMLNTLYQNHHDRIEIITVLVDNDKNVVSSFLKRSKYPWTFLHYGNQAEIIKDYDIRAFPIYYLIAPDGKLAISPAPGPGDDLEARLFQLMKARGDL